MKNAITIATVLGLCAACLASCSGADIAAEKKAAAEANDKLNGYCDARTKALAALQGDGGSP